MTYFNTHCVGAHHIIMQMHWRPRICVAFTESVLYAQIIALYWLGKDELLNYGFVVSRYKSQSSPLHIKESHLEVTETFGG